MNPSLACDSDSFLSNHSYMFHNSSACLSNYSSVIMERLSNLSDPG